MSKQEESGEPSVGAPRLPVFELLPRLTPALLDPTAIYQVNTRRSRAWIADGLAVLAGEDFASGSYFVRRGRISHSIAVGSADWINLSSEGVTAYEVISISSRPLVEEIDGVEYWQAAPYPLTRGLWRVHTSSGSTHALHVTSSEATTYMRDNGADQALAADGQRIRARLVDPIVAGVPALLRLFHPTWGPRTRRTADVTAIEKW